MKKMKKLINQASFMLNERVSETTFKSERCKNEIKIRNWIFSGAILVGIAFSGTLKAQKSDMTPLFNGKSLEGWKVRSGTATYKVEDGTIVGTTVEGSANTFLCTLKEYGDFILEFEVKCDPKLNSGVQFRSHFYEKEIEVAGNNGNKRKWPADRMFGYQFEISSGGSGGVYDEARRAVFIGDSRTKAGKLKDNEWNKCRIIAQGDHFQTFVNGEAVADFHDTMDTKGFFGLQVHQVGKGQGPYSVRWRNIMIRELRPGGKQ